MYKISSFDIKNFNKDIFTLVLLECVKKQFIAP